MWTLLFGEKTLILKSFTTSEILPTIKQVQIIDKKDFIIAILDANSKMFVIYVAI